MSSGTQASIYIHPSIQMSLLKTSQASGLKSASDSKLTVSGIVFSRLESAFSDLESALYIS